MNTYNTYSSNSPLDSPSRDDNSMMIIGVLSSLLILVIIILFATSPRRKAASLDRARERAERLEQDARQRQEFLAQQEQERIKKAESDRIEKLNQENKLRQKMMAWYKVENLAPDKPLYDFYHTGVYTPYQAVATKDEINIVNLLLRWFSPYCIFVDTYIRRPRGKLAQIDIIAVGKHGIFVFESKGYNGWVFGTGKSTKWMQSLAGGHSRHQFYNPLKQNSAHITAIKNIIDSKYAESFLNLIVFGSTTVIKKMEYIPKGCYVLAEHRIHDVMSEIARAPECLTTKDVAEICKAIRAKRIIPDNDIRHEHVSSIEDALGTSRVYR